MAEIENVSNGDNLTQNVCDEMLPPLLKEYDIHVKDLQSQVDFYKEEHGKLQTELFSLLKENQSLAEELKKSLNSQLNYEYLRSPRHRKDSDMVANLQRQLVLTMQEKDSAVEMWQMALREVDNLEEELRSYQDNRQVELAQRQFDGVKQEYSTAITMLEAKLTEVQNETFQERALREALELQLTEALADKLNLDKHLKEREGHLDTALEGHQKALERLQAVESLESSLSEEVCKLKESREELEMALVTCHKHIKELSEKEYEARGKVQEALSVVDSALAERDSSVMEQNRLIGENAKLQKIVTDLIEDAGVQVKEEVNLVKKQFNSRMEHLLHDMKNLQLDLDAKTIHLEKTIKDRDMLDEELNRLRNDMKVMQHSGTTSLERTLQNVYQDLAKMEKSNLETKDERDRLLSKMQEMHHSHQLELQQKLTECLVLKEQLRTLQMQAGEASQAEAAAVAQVDSLVKYIESLQTHRIGMQDQQEQNYKQWLQEDQRLIEQLNEMQKKGLEMAKEMQMHLKSQVSAKQKWQNKVKSIIEKFEDRIQSLRVQLSYLQKVNVKLEEDLIETRNELEHYTKQ